MSAAVLISHLPRFSMMPSCLKAGWPGLFLPSRNPSRRSWGNLVARGLIAVHIPLFVMAIAAENVGVSRRGCQDLDEIAKLQWLLGVRVLVQHVKRARQQRGLICEGDNGPSACGQHNVLGLTRLAARSSMNFSISLRFQATRLVGAMMNRDGKAPRCSRRSMVESDKGTNKTNSRFVT
jgi:hypothetical protein